MNSTSNIVSRGTIDKLDRFIDLLSQWNDKINLVAGSNKHEWWVRHIEDSLQLLSNMNIPDTNTAADIGTGGGFPGLVLAIATEIEWRLVESDRRKVAFLQHVAAQLKLTHVKVISERIENCDFNVDILTSRALAPLPHLLGYAENLLTSDGFCLFLKGENYANELEEAQKDWEFSYQSFPSISNAESRIIKIMQPISKRAHLL